MEIRKGLKSKMELKYEVKQNTTIRKVLQNELKLSYRLIKNFK